MALQPPIPNISEVVFSQPVAGTIHMEWTGVAGGHFKLQWRKIGDAWSGVIGTTSTSHDFSGATPGFIYEFRVYTVKNTRQTLPDFYSYLPIDPALRGVRNLQFRQVGSTFVIIEWDDDNFKKILRWVKDGTDDFEYRVIDPAVHEATVTGLEPGMNYRFYVDQYADVGGETVQQGMGAEQDIYLDKTQGCCIGVDNSIPPTTTTTTTTSTTSTTTIPV